MLENKIIFVAGACGRIGSSLCKSLIKARAKIIIADINLQKAKLLEQSLNNENQILSTKIDICKAKSINKAIAKALEKFAQIDGFVNCAYPLTKHWGKKGYYDYTYKELCKDLNSHLAGFMLASCEFVKFFKKQGFGNIVHLSSIMGVYAPKFENYQNTTMQSPLAYSVIKAGINHLGVWLAKELFNTNIRVNTLSSGGILDNQDANFLQAYRKHCASKGMLEADDLNALLLFLLSDGSRFITGQNFIIDDGWGL